MKRLTNVEQYLLKTGHVVQRVMFLTGSVCFRSTIIASVERPYPFCEGQLQSLE